MGTFTKFLEGLIAFGLAVGFEVFGVLGAPVLATRLTNIIKAGKRIVWNKHWHPAIYHIITWLLTLGLSFYSFQFKYENVEAMLFVATIVAFFNSALVEWMHRKAAKNETAKAVFNKILMVSEEDYKMSTRIHGFVAGIKVKTEGRVDPDVVRESWTKERREREAAMTEVTIPKEK